MRKTLFIISILIFVMLFSSCAGEEKTSTKKDNYDFIVLTDTQVSNFTQILPEILDFAGKYSAGLSQEEKDSFEYYKKFFKAMKQSSKIKSASLENNFSSVDELIMVYKNVTLAYDSIKNELTNYTQDIKTLDLKIKEFESNYGALISTNTTEYSQTQLEEIAQGITNNQIRYQNIILVKKFEKTIDKIVNSFQK